jgi:molybdopterin synthase sulfur carrier subunit
MQVRVLFFGATADDIGKRSIDFTVDNAAKVDDTLDELLSRFPQLVHHKLRFAVNQEYVAHDRVLNDGDELAIFTAVSGG